MSAIFDQLSGNNKGLSQAQRATHTYVIGQPGVGKSRALESWIRQDIALGHGVARLLRVTALLFSSLAFFHLSNRIGPFSHYLNAPAAPGARPFDP